MTPGKPGLTTWATTSCESNLAKGICNHGVTYSCDTSEALELLHMVDQLNASSEPSRRGLVRVQANRSWRNKKLGRVPYYTLNTEPVFLPERVPLAASTWHYYERVHQNLSLSILIELRWGLLPYIGRRNNRMYTTESQPGVVHGRTDELTNLPPPFERSTRTFWSGA